MDQLNQVAHNMVKILSDWKDESDKYKANIEKFQAGLHVQAASLQNFINSNLATQSNATKNVEKASGKRPLPQSSNETASPSKRMKNNDGEPVASCKLLIHLRIPFYTMRISLPLIFHSQCFFY